MVHSFALDPKALATVEDLVRAAAPEHSIQLFKASGFTSLAEQGPRVKLAEQIFPEMGQHYAAFDAFFWHRPSLEYFTRDVPFEAGLLISTARAMKIDEKGVFDRIELWSKADESELLAVGTIRFGTNTLHFPIAQWLTPVDDINIVGWTTLDDILLWHQRVLNKQARKQLRRKRLRATAATGALAVPMLLAPAVIFLQPVLAAIVGVLGFGLFIGGIDMQSRLGKLLLGTGIAAFFGGVASFLYIMDQIAPGI